MNASIAIRANAPQSLLSAPLRIGAAVAIAFLLVLAVVTARHESQQAVQNATGVLSRDTARVTLPSVEVVGRRERASAVRGGGAG
ncbi:hypothetical protein RAMLITH_21745 [Ramlibacter sp. RBP-2]|uniref:Uncharacterized protein n=1 Tax=Ramlibacter lithotrophicus TaxID=2606681 RepID=A0A7X6DJU0_9BURK|nr:hypothetical protein [Ramlibacter lithotrophicus]NKE68445.1 hypothetical protein [Ramlibacter lithotrophicus]